MEKRMNKKAQDLSIGTLILIVLGIVVLVLLILGFSIGWTNLWEKINIFKGSSSVADVITACKIAQSAGDTYTLCNDFKQIKVEGKTEYLNCADPRVSPSLSAVSCADSLRTTKCSDLKTAGVNIADIKVNNLACPA